MLIVQFKRLLSIAYLVPCTPVTFFSTYKEHARQCYLLVVARCLYYLIRDVPRLLHVYFKMKLSGSSSLALVDTTVEG